MEKIITSFEQLDPSRVYTYADYLTWQLDGFVELIKGKIFKMAAPSTDHQRILVRIAGRLERKLKKTKCEAFVAPFDVRLTHYNHITETDITTTVQPDICVICNPEILDKRGCWGTPDTIMEIVSPSTGEKDMTLKYALYEECGVKEYWLIFPNENVVQIFDLNESTQKYEMRGFFAKSDNPEVRTIGFKVLLAEIFEGIGE